MVGDLVRIGSGDQIPADGDLVRAEGLALDESELTGESEPVVRRIGDAVLSGSFAVEGEGDFEATAVGADSHAAQADRDRARLPPPALAAGEGDGPAADRDGRDDGCRSAIGLGVSLALRDVSQSDAVETLTAGIVNIVPEGLILLVSLTAAVTAAKMARHGILAQQLNAIESLASVSVMCTDKTGTLTEASLRVVELIPAEGSPRRTWRGRLGTYAASAPTRNSTLEAIHAAGLGDGDGAARSRPRRSRSPRGGAGARSSSDGRRLVLGAPEALLDGATARRDRRPGACAAATRRRRDRAASEAAAGRRVLALASYGAPLPEAGPDVELTEPLHAARRSSSSPRSCAPRRPRRSPSSPARKSR